MINHAEICRESGIQSFGAVVRAEDQDQPGRAFPSLPLCASAGHRVSHDVKPPC